MVILRRFGRHFRRSLQDIWRADARTLALVVVVTVLWTGCFAVLTAGHVDHWIQGLLAGAGTAVGLLWLPALVIMGIKAGAAGARDVLQSAREEARFRRMRAGPGPADGLLSEVDAGGELGLPSHEAPGTLRELTEGSRE